MGVVGVAGRRRLVLEVAEHTEAREVAGQEEVEKLVVADWGWEEGGGE